MVGYFYIRYVDHFLGINTRVQKFPEFEYSAEAVNPDAAPFSADSISVCAAR